ncbi:ATP-binding protein [Yoonia sp. F2084L]|uniref:ATP-binding protein n=1 Tax=Yoonia sp. F2084L TaxID=2926419 RepID=UPI001FF4DACE|nr:ATP-binding protein [Yoonia sp. F2084L]MCK0097068.1 ATP-binding protein [Yoonia sp. F2084L]
MTSLRARAVSGGILWAVVIIVLGLAGISSYMTAQTQARFTDLVQARHSQAVVAVSNNGASAVNLVRAIGDPVYQRPFSGQYWQVEGSEGQLYRSPSLVDASLPRPNTTQGGRVAREYRGPNGDPVFGIAEWLTLPDGSLWHIQVASSLRSLEADTQELRQTLLTAFAIIAFVGVLGALAQVAVVLQPLNTLRKEVSTRWEHENGLSVDSYPIEVAPLVTDINSLMDRNREIMSRSRRQAADLAHAIKTPSAIMRNELDTLRSKGVAVQDSIDALDRLDAQLKRSFARMRADGTDGAVGVVTELDTALGRMKRAFEALSRNSDKTFSATFDEGLRVRMDQSDFEEVMGNLLDNALKWAASQVRLSASQADQGTVMITISDDGPGIPKEERSRAMDSGQRLDTSKPGTGLGLAIASDLVHAYGGKIILSQDEDLGGLAVQLSLPAAAAQRPD